MRVVVTRALALLAAATSVSAHHSFAAQYDAAKPLTLTGTVVKIDWTNPHIHIFLDVKDGKGSVIQWKLEGFPPNMLIRQGWQRDVTLKPGAVITVAGWHARLEANEGAARYVTFSDGRKMASGPPAGTWGQ